MRRPILPRARLHGLLAGAALLLAACGAGDPAEVSLAELAFAAEDHHGERIATVGVVRVFTVEDDDALEDHYAIEDADRNRVELVPHEAVAEHVDREVRVVGAFRFDPATGRLLEVEDIAPTDRPADLARARVPVTRGLRARWTRRARVRRPG